MKVLKLFKNWEITNKKLYNELIRVNKELITRWNIKVWLWKISKLQKIDEVYNAYLFYEDDNLVWFWLILNEDWENSECNDIKNKFQKTNDNVYWLANYFIYPEFRWKWYWIKCFEELLNITKEKDFYLYTDIDNYANKIYSKFMDKIWVFEDKKNVYLKSNN